ncbi:hypothetical protein N9E91_03140 [Alphaproteobacteria bacterium]|nr:hypothetical protein [Alphaproteobacteria bacterium]
MYFIKGNAFRKFGVFHLLTILCFTGIGVIMGTVSAFKIVDEPVKPVTFRLQLELKLNSLSDRELVSSSLRIPNLCYDVSGASVAGYLTKGGGVQFEFPLENMSQLNAKVDALAFECKGKVFEIIMSRLNKMAKSLEEDLTFKHLDKVTVLQRIERAQFFDRFNFDSYFVQKVTRVPQDNGRSGMLGKPVFLGAVGFLLGLLTVLISNNNHRSSTKKE